MGPVMANICSGEIGAVSISGGRVVDRATNTGVGIGMIEEMDGGPFIDA